ncbi:MAG: alkaline phosphatase D family protein [Bryobacteraceae bacterium]
MNRRQFVAAAASLATAASGAAQAFDLGVASGDPRVNGILLWTRVNPAAYIGGNVDWVIAPDRGLTNIVAAGSAAIAPTSDYTVKVDVRNAALQPFTTYYYQFRYNGTASRVARFKTLPAPGGNLNRVRLGFMSCQDYTNGYYTAMAGMAQEDLDYVVHLGDYIYESVGDPIFQGSQIRSIGVLPSGGFVAANVEDYRFLYRTYRSDLNLQLLHESFAFIQIWDDHEFANDAWQDYHPDNTTTPRVPDPALRAAATKAWTEYIPAAVSSVSPQLYRSFGFGSLAELIVTDQRLYRDGPPCGLDSDQRTLTKACPEVDSSGRTMLGGAQKQWFISRLTSSTAVWKIWANELTCMPLKAKNDLDGSGDIFITLDAWDGYRSERTSILTALAGVKNLVAVTGDIHSFGAGYLQPDYESDGQPKVGVEFLGGSVTSANFTDELASATGLVSSAVPKAKLAVTPIGILARIVNPHLEFFNSATHGYGILELTARAATCTLRQVSTITATTGTVTDLVKFLVPRDQVVLRRV